MDDKALVKIAELKRVAKDDTVQYFKDLTDSNSKKIDIAKLKHFIFKYSDHALDPTDDDLEYIIKYFSEGEIAIDIHQFQSLVESLIVMKFLDSKEGKDFIK